MFFSDAPDAPPRDPALGPHHAEADPDVQELMRKEFANINVSLELP